VVIFTLLQVVASNDLDLSYIIILLPLKEVNLLQQLLFMMLQLSHCAAIERL
jgi:hypothetical protein